jgi:hypothetical protein
MGAAMKLERSNKRMTLRDLLTHAEKGIRDLIDHVNADVMRYTVEFRDLNRPVRRRSNYPTLQAVYNALQKLEEAAEEAMVFCDYLLEHMETIRDNSKREVRTRV